jgi:hypothetical protein
MAVPENIGSMTASATTLVIRQPLRCAESIRSISLRPMAIAPINPNWNDHGVFFAPAPEAWVARDHQDCREASPEHRVASTARIPHFSVSILRTTGLAARTIQQSDQTGAI